eukprot:TRINITY_DN31969_c0_g1_i1.p1 TRINITY_DN31969_c0_g1~~TRINITY_DN31969_c0_g1_i1.p1  ORF type:complete len:115 (+),score=19.31 TRINITY_DN31969_c0_g1_i1:522-866(+)
MFSARDVRTDSDTPHSEAPRPRALRMSPRGIGGTDSSAPPPPLRPSSVVALHVRPQRLHHLKRVGPLVRVSAQQPRQQRLVELRARRPRPAAAAAARRRCGGVRHCRRLRCRCR